ncbi:hypothetical protein [Bacillus sp. REN10]|uniref:hypothetical protein n=1 Tax=Bacillus sp. REN10 TaxID=2782541 RepID=UPI00193B478F|nr:hypothetical protein [Bacillus sp. REN10]
MRWYTIGALTVPASQLAFVLAFLLLSFYLWCKKEKKIVDLYGNAVFLFILVWKFSIVIFSFSIVMEAPMSLLYFNGGGKGFWLAFIIVCLYVFWKWPRQQWNDAIQIWLMMIVLFEGLLAMLNGQAGGLDLFRFAGGAAALAFFRRSPLQVLMLFTLWQLLFESWAGNLFSMNGLSYSVMAVYFVMLRRKNVG